MKIKKTPTFTNNNGEKLTLSQLILGQINMDIFFYCFTEKRILFWKVITKKKVHISDIVIYRFENNSVIYIKFNNRKKFNEIEDIDGVEKRQFLNVHSPFMVKIPIKKIIKIDW